MMKMYGLPMMLRACSLLLFLATAYTQVNGGPPYNSPWAQPSAECTEFSQATLFHSLRHIGLQGKEQMVVGPVQDDEALLLFAMTRALGVNRVLEVGGLLGFSARNFLEAVACTPAPAVYTLDLDAVPRVGPRHFTIQKSAELLTAADLHNKPVDLLMLDCHHYPATTELLRRLLREDLLAPNALIALHDTGLHPVQGWFNWSSIESRQGNVATVKMPDTEGRMHQPVERLVAQWLVKYDCNGDWQTIVVHDDAVRGGVAAMRHGLTLMQRRVSLYVPRHVCSNQQWGLGGTGPQTVEECVSVQSKTPMPHCVESRGKAKGVGKGRGGRGGRGGWGGWGGWGDDRGVDRRI